MKQLYIIEKKVITEAKKFVTWLRVPDHIFEICLVSCVLVITASFSNKGAVEWLGVIGVILLLSTH